MGIALLLLTLGVLAAVGAFADLRAVVARASGVRGVSAALGFEHSAWATVPLGRRVLYALAGPLGVYLAAAAFMTVGLLLDGEVSIDEASTRVAVAPGGPAAEAGLRDGDRIVAVNEQPIADWAQLKREVARSPGEPIRVAIERDGARLVLTPTPSEQGKIGVGQVVERRPVGFLEALGGGLAAPPRTWASAARGFGRIFAGREEVDAAGPVAIVQTTCDAAKPGQGAALKLVAALMSYFAWIPVLLALVTFPRRPKPARA